MAMLQDIGNIEQSIFHTSKRDQSHITHKKSKESMGENGQTTIAPSDLMQTSIHHQSSF
jgi:hypothetical protein